MSELKAQDYYNEMKDIVEVPYFTKLTSTGISPDYESIFDFAEAYFDARMEANGVTTGVEQCNLPDVVQQSEQFKAIVFKMANMLAIANKGNEAVQMHRIHNSI